MTNVSPSKRTSDEGRVVSLPNKKAKTTLTDEVPSSSIGVESSFQQEAVTVAGGTITASNGTTSLVGGVNSGIAAMTLETPSSTVYGDESQTQCIPKPPAMDTTTTVDNKALLPEQAPPRQGTKSEVLESEDLTDATPEETAATPTSTPIDKSATNQPATPQKVIIKRSTGCFSFVVLLLSGVLVLSNLLSLGLWVQSRLEANIQMRELAMMAGAEVEELLYGSPMDTLGRLLQDFEIQNRSLSFRLAGLEGQVEEVTLEKISLEMDIEALETELEEEADAHTQQMHRLQTENDSLHSDKEWLENALDHTQKVHSEELGRVVEERDFLNSQTAQLEERLQREIDARAAAAELELEEERVTKERNALVAEKQEFEAREKKLVDEYSSALNERLATITQLSEQVKQWQSESDALRTERDQWVLASQEAEQKRDEWRRQAEEALKTKDELSEIVEGQGNRIGRFEQEQEDYKGSLGKLTSERDALRDRVEALKEETTRLEERCANSS